MGLRVPMFETGAIKAQFTAAPDASLLAYDDYDSTSQNACLEGDGNGRRQ